MAYKLYTDGGARGNPGPAGAGVVLYDSKDQLVVEVQKYLGPCTNNDAEYAALIMGLELALAHEVSELTCYLDSELIVRQLNGQYKVKNERLKKYFDKVLELKFQFSDIRFVHVPRTENTVADRLVNAAIDSAM
jgi:ribonuclease HI